MKAVDRWQREGGEEKERERNREKGIEENSQTGSP